MPDLEKLIPFIPMFALGISILALVLSGTSLGWNIYRDVILKARVRVRFQISEIHHPTFSKALSRICITVTNFGPGKVKCEMIVYKKTSLLRRLRRKAEQGIIFHNYIDPLSGKLPTVLEVGERLHLPLPYTQDCCLGNGTTHIGISDSFGREHWAPRSSVKRARKQFLKDGDTLPKTAQAR